MDFSRKKNVLNFRFLFGSPSFIPLSNNVILFIIIPFSVFEKNVGSKLPPLTSSPLLAVSVRAYDTTVTDGNDALLKCTANSELFHVVAWITDDEDIILPLKSSFNDIANYYCKLIFFSHFIQIFFHI